MKKTAIFVCLLLVCCLLVSSVVVVAPKPEKPPKPPPGGGGDEPGTEYKITDTTTAASWPSVYGNLMVWQDHRNGEPDIYMYDLGEDGIPFTDDDGGESQLTSDPKRDWDPVLWGDKVVFRRVMAGSSDFDLFLVDISSGIEYQMSDDMEHNTHDIYDNVLVIKRDHGQIWVHDLGPDGIPSADDVEYIIANGVEPAWPRIHGNKIVYNNNQAINIYYLSGDLEGQTLSMSIGHDLMVTDVYENYVVWSDRRNGNSDVFLYDLGPDGVPGTPDDGGESQFSRNRNEDIGGRVHGDKIIWNSYKNVKNGWERNEDIILHDLTSDETHKITDSGDARGCKIHGNNIVYSDERDGKYNVYLYKLNP